MAGPVPDYGFEDVVFSDRFVVVASAAEAAVEVDCSGASVTGAVLWLCGRGDGVGRFVEGGFGRGGGGGKCGCVHLLSWGGCGFGGRGGVF